MNIFQIRRKTLETDIEIKINFFGNGFFKIKTFLFYFDHIFSQFINYSLFDCYLRCYSDLKIDSHHAIEDISICLGKILIKKKINRYNTNFIIMDDVFLLISIDSCNRIFYYDNFLKLDFDIQLVREFFSSFSKNFKCCLYIYCFNYFNKHHLIESIFKLFGIIFKKAKNKKKLYSTKGIL
ncbi:imidazoleglycerol-phosphate dehydratase [Candidatus Carsonella ruddii]|uniref:Imidazoleglycerol-phosphate dehydratase n=1 Tax=Candidatus Carsonella ruddii HC isolate Thao2000 TaxID=1202538 RepID=J3VPU4_CARRU|nr:imidazoleglycerol-phosphate dehydratase [Candidatus Carsonella ruddii]AFP83926.1 imidazoleglycerol-phosphate dehydratase [Candidatus Carsonella ruddii HC isolate Thao2000]